MLYFCCTTWRGDSKQNQFDSSIDVAGDCYEADVNLGKVNVCPVALTCHVVETSDRHPEILRPWALVCCSATCTLRPYGSFRGRWNFPRWNGRSRFCKNLHSLRICLRIWFLKPLQVWSRHPHRSFCQYHFLVWLLSIGGAAKNQTVSCHDQQAYVDKCSIFVGGFK